MGANPPAQIKKRTRRVAPLLRPVHAQVSLIFPQPPYDYKSMKEIHMAEGDPRAGITETGIDSPQGIEAARKVSRFQCLGPSGACPGAGWLHHTRICTLAKAMHICTSAILSSDKLIQTTTSYRAASARRWCTSGAVSLPSFSSPSGRCLRSPQGCSPKVCCQGPQAAR